MRMFDTSPLMRSAIGFDNVSRLLDSVARVNSPGTSYPPYNIEKLGQDRYRILMAVAGFSEDDLDVTVRDEVLIVSGKANTDQNAGERAGQVETNEADKPVYLHRGIAKRAFERRFQLADTVKVEGASLVNGLLHVELVREVPEERKPRRIEINKGSAAPKTIEEKAA